jgi:thiamine biosynthesis lipoprotein
MAGDVVGFEQSRAIHHLEHVMGTVVAIDVYPNGQPWGPEPTLGMARARAVLRRADAIFSTWKQNSPMSRLRRGEISCEDAPGQVGEVLELCSSRARHLGRVV